VLIELTNNVAEPLSLPAWTPTFVILLLVVGFPITIILSWIFDVTPVGIKKTESIEEESKTELSPTATRRGLKASDVIIAVLLIAVCILLYPKVFKSDKYQDIREDDGRISIVVLPFRNSTGDTLNTYYSNMISSILIDVLSRSPELSVIDNQSITDILASRENFQYASMSPALVKELTEGIQVKSYIWGDFIGTKEYILINLRLVDKESSQVITSDSEKTNSDSILTDVHILADRVKNRLEIKSYERDLRDEFGEYAKTISAEAYRLYLDGFRYTRSVTFSENISANYDLAEQSLKSAILIDPTFTEAYVLLARLYGWSKVNYGLENRDQESMEYLELASSSKEKLTAYEQISINQQRAYLEKNQQELIKANAQLVKLRPDSPQHWQYSALDYMNDHQYEKAVQSCEKATELYKKIGHEFAQVMLYLLGYNLHQLGRHEEEAEAFEEALNANTDLLVVLWRIKHCQAVCALSMGYEENAIEHIKEYRSIRESRDAGSYEIESDIAWIYQEAGLPDRAIEILKDLIAANPREPTTLERLGHIQINDKNRVDEGLDLVNQALELDPDNPDFLYTKGLGYYKRGETEEANEILKKAWDLRLRYDYDHLHMLEEIEQSLASQN